jgi:hypothetical protein
MYLQGLNLIRSGRIIGKSRIDVEKGRRGEGEKRTKVKEVEEVEKLKKVEIFRNKICRTSKTNDIQ